MLKWLIVILLFVAASIASTRPMYSADFACSPFSHGARPPKRWRNCHRNRLDRVISNTPTTYRSGARTIGGSGCLTDASSSMNSRTPVGCA